MAWLMLRSGGMSVEPTPAHEMGSKERSPHMKAAVRRYKGLSRSVDWATNHGHNRSVRTILDPHAKLVMIVEDDRRLRRALVRMVLSEFSDAVVIQAENGQDTLDKLAEIRIRYVGDPLLIITDLDMPVMDGWTLIQKLKQDYEQRGASTGIPVLVMSSTSGDKGVPFFQKSVHEGKSGYVPLVAVAKLDSPHQDKYFASGMDGLTTWLRHFLDGDGSRPQTLSVGAKHPQT